MGGGGGDDEERPSSSSSGEEDGDSNWKAAIDSIASVTTPSINRSTAKERVSDGSHSCHDDVKSRQMKHYQIKAQKLLEEMLDETIEVVRESSEEDVIAIDPVVEESGMRLFRTAPYGIVFDHHINMLQGPKKRPRIIPAEEINEKSSMEATPIGCCGWEQDHSFSRESEKRSLAKRDAKLAAAKAAIEIEEKRVAELKRVRGERWLPSIAREMQHQQTNLGRKNCFA